MDFKSVQRTASLLAKPFAQDLLRLLVQYQDLSASEAASRLDLHIKTAQDFLAELADLGIVSKEEVYEKKRPYYRYRLQKYRLSIDVDLTSLGEPDPNQNDRMLLKIRERKNANAVFTVARGGDYLTSVTIFTGTGRSKKERKINLTRAQGMFLYHLPFPTAQLHTVNEIIKQANINENHYPEILDIINVLIGYNIIEYVK
jgi:hypothetical protein